VITAEEHIANCLTHIYDAESAHQYYLRTRDLKGREAAAQQPTPMSKTSVSKTVQPKAAPKAAPAKQTPEQRRAAISSQVDALRAKLETLKKVLADLVQQAKARSGVDPEPEPTQGQPRQTSDNPRKLTPEQQDAAAQRAKDWREANPDKAMDQEAAKLTKQVEAVQDKIQAMREKLAEVLVNPFHSTGSVGAESNTPMRKDGNSQNGS
jgi:hypothetical protein